MSYFTERYRERKLQHLCTRCGNRDERTANGKALCTGCAEMQNQALKRYYESHRRKCLLYRSERAQRLISEGRCQKCGKPAEDGKTYCRACLLMYKEHRITGKWPRKTG